MRKIFISKIFTRKAWGTYLIILSYKNIRNINKAFIELAGANILEEESGSKNTGLWLRLSC